MKRTERFWSLLGEGADAALISTPKNQFYLSHFSFDDGYLLLFPDAAFLLTDFRYAEAARAHAASGYTVLCPARGEGQLELIARLMKEHGACRLAVEGSLSLSFHARLCAALSGVTVTAGAEEPLSTLRACKDAGELASIAAAQELTDAAFTHILSVLNRRMTERDVALELEYFMRKSGSEGVAFSTIAVSGRASALPHGVPRDCPLEKGFLTMDFGARIDGYAADMTRTVVIGHADEEMAHLYHTVLSAQTAALSAAKSGMSCNALDRTARDIIENAGYHGRFGHSLGHGVGLDVHEEPRLSPSSKPDEVLFPGAVVTVEPGIYIEGRYGCRIEDMIAVTEEGRVHNFTRSTKELLEI